MTAPEIELAWSAGFFDGEGWAGVQTGRTTPKLKIDNSDLPLLRRFYAAVGELGVVVDEPLKRDVPEHYRPMFQWRVSGVDALAVAEVLLPYVGQRNIDRFTTLRDDYRALHGRTCEGCGEPFLATTRTDARFCSKACADRKRRPRREQAERPCEACGNPFRPAHSDTRWCSRKCWRAGRRAAGLPAS